MGDMVKFKVTGPAYAGHEIEAEAGASLLQALEDNGYVVPHLCYHEAVSAYGACRLCLVEVVKRGRAKLTTACNYPVMEGIEVRLDTESVQRNRKMVLELLMGLCPGSPELAELGEQYGVDERDNRFEPQDNDCILCGLCERVCREVVGANAITFSRRGDRKEVEPPFGSADDCIGCGACAYVCPVDCIKIEQRDGKKIIVRWNRELEMQVDPVSGAPLAPKFMLDRFRAQTNLPADFYDRAPWYKDAKS